MGFTCGIVGLPNVGKSTLFNALTATANAEAANYPFCTIEPNSGRVSVPDPRLEILAGLAKSAQTVPTFLEFVDIAGLVRGASKGEGLGNQFLGHIRETDAICHVLRCFEDDDITHVEGGVDPVRDAETVTTELILADLESVEKRLVNQQKRQRGGDKEAQRLVPLLEAIAKTLGDGFPARMTPLDEDGKTGLKELQLITAKPVLYIANVEEDAAATGNSLSAKVEEMAAKEGAEVVVISAAIEAEVAQLSDPEEKKEFLETLGLAEPGLAKVIRAGYRLLNLITFFTAGPKESRAWTVRHGARAPEAAGVIHTDFERGFIRAETISFDDYVTSGSEQAAKEAGRMRAEGRDYKVVDGDVFLFRFNV